MDQGGTCVFQVNVRKLKKKTNKYVRKRHKGNIPQYSHMILKTTEPRITKNTAYSNSFRYNRI